MANRVVAAHRFLEQGNLDPDDIGGFDDWLTISADGATEWR